MKNNVVEITQEDRKRGNIINALASTLRRTFGAALFGESPDGKRNYKQIFGYLDDPSYADYRGMYRRGGIAHTVVAKIAKACWRNLPILKEGDNEILKDMVNDLHEAGFFKAFERADILNRIGRLSVLFIGIQDGLDFDQPLGTGGSLEDIYFRVYGEDGIEISKFDTDPMSIRFGLPIVYQLTVTNLTNSKGKTAGARTVNVHYTRVVVLAEGLLENDIEGSSALEPVWDALIDKDKVRGSAAESYYRNARQKFVLEAAEGSKIDTSPEGVASLNAEVQEFTNDYRDFMRIKDMKANVIQPNMIDPRGAFDIAVEEISGQTGIPIRVLTGKGGGQLAGSEDKAAWNALILDRENQECTTWLLVGLRILEAATIIDELPKTLIVEWPEQSALTEKEKSEVNKNKATSLKDLSAARSLPGGDEIVLESALDELDLGNIETEEITDRGEPEDE